MLQKKYQQISELFLVFGLFFLSNISVFINIIWLDPALVHIEAVTWAILAVVSVKLLNQNGLLPVFLNIVKKNRMLLPFLVFAGVTIFWSMYWEISLSRWLTLLFTMIAAGYIGLRYDLKEIIKLLSVFGIYILFLSILLVFFVPKVGIMNYYNIQGAWRGVFWHKNHMGLIATFINILFLINTFQEFGSQKWRAAFLWGALYIFSLIFVYQSDSVAAYLTTIFLHGIVLLVLLWIKFGKKISRRHYLYFCAALILAAIVLFFNVDRFFGMFDRNVTLTGRTPMWSYLFSEYLSERSFGGYGFNAFWYISSHRVATQLAAEYPDPIVIADNGFIDILMNTGYAGLVLFILFYLVLWWRSIKCAAKAVDLTGMFPLILMIYTLLANISWSLIFENDNFFMLVMLSVLFSMSRPSEGQDGLL